MHARQPMHAVAVQIDDAVAAPEERVGRADVHARRLLALVAQHRQEEPPRVRERALLDRLDPAAIHADGNVVLGLARDRARVTSDALREVDRETVVGHGSSDYNANGVARQALAPPRARAGNVSSTCANVARVQSVPPARRPPASRALERRRLRDAMASRRARRGDAPVCRRPSPDRHRQSLHQTRRHVSAHEHAHDGVEHVAVEEAAQEMLLLDRRAPCAGRTACASSPRPPGRSRR